MASESLQVILFFTLLAALTHWLAWRFHFFTWPQSKSSKESSSLFTLVASGFAIYLGISLVAAPFASRLIQSFVKEDSPIRVVSYLQVFILGSTSLLLILLALNNRAMMKTLWKDRESSPSSIATDMGVGALTWLISFPAVVLIGQLADLFIYLVFHVENYEQVAVRYLKMALESPSLFLIAMVSILIFAPFIEEFLFRGLLQSWIKRKLGAKAAILIASLCFALFHLAGSQGVGNISLFISLFTLACYLGFIYERQGSLYASISLHMTFNAISTLRILLT